MSGLRHQPERSTAEGDARRTYRLAGQDLVAPRLGPGLYVAATPIGNLRDVTVRALETLAAADLIVCEDTRVTRKLVDAYGVATPLFAYHEHNAASVRPGLLARLEQGAALALVSDAGTPLVSDPGFKLVRSVRAAGIPVFAVPGASAVLAALTVAGLPTDRFVFEGFLPAKEGARQARAAALARVDATLIVFESGPRLAATLADLAAALGPREAAICRELTKLHEEVQRGDLPALAEAYRQSPPPRGEIVVVVGPPAEAAPASENEVEALLRGALARLSVKDAVREVAAITGASRSHIYRRALALNQGPADAGD